jgi:hypothetical protein
MASYTGQRITYEDALNSKEDLTPSHFDWEKPLPAMPIPVPGITKFV